MATYGPSLSRVVATLAVLALAGCGSPAPASSVHLDSAAVSGIALSFEGEPLVVAGWEPLAAGQMAVDIAEYLSPETVSPDACRRWHVERYLVSESDEGSGDEILDLGTNDRQTLGSEALYVAVTARVFGDSSAAAAYFEDLAGDARACTHGYEWMASANAETGGEELQVVTESVTTGDVSIVTERSLRGAKVLAVQEDDVVGFYGDYYETFAQRHVYIAYGNVVIAVGDMSNDRGEPEPVSDAQWDDLIEQVVSGLEAASA
jgi:hypothetical protein